MFTRLILSMIILAFVVIPGCSGRGSPIAPDPAENSQMTNSFCQSNVDESTSGLHNLLVYRLFKVDPSALSLESVPLRISGTHWNVLNWLEYGPCTDCLSVALNGTNPDGHLMVDVSITHPFDNPILTGYDVLGIVIFNGSASFPVSGLTYSNGDVGDGELVNADGFTTLYNFKTAGSGPDGLQGYIEGKLATQAIPNSHLNGFKRFNSQDAGNTFITGDTVTVTYEIDMPDGPFVFGYAVDASWEPPAGGHMVEPWKIDIEVIPVDDGLTEAGGQEIIEATYYPYTTLSNFHTPQIECPALFDGKYGMEWVGGDQFGVSPQVFRLTIENKKPAMEGDYPLLIKVESIENDPDLTPWLDLSAYQIGSIHVSEIPVVAIAYGSPNPQAVGADINFSGADSFDPDGGEIVLYDWDWDLDGVYDASGMEANHSWSNPGVYEIQLRVTDDQSDTGVLEEPLKIWIESGTLDNPVDVTPAGLDFNANDIAVDGTFAYVSVQDEGIKVLDISSPQNASIIDSYDISTANRLEITNDLLCVEEGDSIHLLNISDPYNVTEGGTVNQTHTAFAANGDYLYILDWIFLYTWIINPPETAEKENQVLCGYMTDNPGNDVAVGNNQAIVGFDWLSDPMITSAGLQFYDISNPPWSPKIQQFIPIPGGPSFLQTVRACDSYALVGRTYGNQVWDITEPAHSSVIATLNELGWLRDAVFTEQEGFMVACTNESSTAFIFDMAPPESAYQIGSVDLSGQIRNMAYSDGYVYLTTNDFGLRIFRLWAD